MFDVVEIQSKQGNWEIIQVVEKIETLHCHARWGFGPNWPFTTFRKNY